jgi:hypothetical protein
MFSAGGPATRAPGPITGTVKDGPDADGLILVGWIADAVTDADAADGYERVQWVSEGGYVPAVGDDALMLLSASGDPWVLVSTPAGVRTPVAVMREAPLNVNYPEFGGDINLTTSTAYEAGGGDVFIPPGEYFNVHIARTWDARVTVNLIGGGKESTVLHGNGTDPVIDFSASVAQLETYSDVRDLAIIGSAKTYDGIKLDGNARLRLQNLDIRACAKGIRNLGGLVMAIEACTIQGNNDGLYCRLSAQTGGPPPNLVVVSGTNIIGNSNRGIDFGDGQSLIICDGSDIEGNGTIGDVTTGGLYVQNTVDDLIGYGHVVIRDSWFESNRGRSIQAYSGDLIISATPILSAEAGRAVYARGLRKLGLYDVHAPSTGDTIDADSTNIYAELRGGVLATVSVSAVVNRFEDVQTSGGTLNSALRPPLIAAAAAPNNSFYQDNFDGKAYFRDNAGVAHALY